MLSEVMFQVVEDQLVVQQGNRFFCADYSFCEGGSCFGDGHRRRVQLLARELEDAVNFIEFACPAAVLAFDDGDSGFGRVLFPFAFRAFAGQVKKVAHGDAEMERTAHVEDAQQGGPGHLRNPVDGFEGVNFHKICGGQSEPFTGNSEDDDGLIFCFFGLFFCGDQLGPFVQIVARSRAMEKPPAVFGINGAVLAVDFF